MSTDPPAAAALDVDDVVALLSRDSLAARTRVRGLLSLAAAADTDRAQGTAAFLTGLGQEWYQVPPGQESPWPHPVHHIADAYQGAGTETLRDALALMLYAEVIHAWDLWWDQVPMRSMIDTALAVRSHAHVPGHEDDTEDTIAHRAAASSPAWACLALLREAFSVYAASLTGRLDLVAATTHRFVTTASSILEGFTTPPGALAAPLLADIREKITFYGFWRDAATAAHRFLQRQPGSLAGLRETAAALRAYLRHEDLPEAYMSEIRNELSALEALEQGAVPGVDGEPAPGWLRIDEGEMVVLYPFGIRSPTSTTGPDVVRTVRQAHRQEAGFWTLAGMTAGASGARPLELDDSWSARGDDALRRRYAGVQLDLPDLVVRQADAGLVSREWRIGIQIRFSELGNHHLRFIIPIRDAGPATIHEAALLSSPLFGNTGEIAGLDLISPLGAVQLPDLLGQPAQTQTPHIRWARLAEVAETVVGDLEHHLRSAMATSLQVTSRPGLYSVLTVISRASRWPRWEGPAEPLIDARELEGLFGLQPLIHPVPGGTISIADWVSYDLDGARAWSSLSLNREFLRTNANLGVLASFHSPHYSVLTMRGFIEFADSLHGTFAAWQDEIADHATWLGRELDDLAENLAEFDLRLQALDDQLARANGSWSTAGLAQVRSTIDDRVARIERAQLTLKRSLVAAQVTQHFIDSPNLVTSASLRSDVDTALAATGYPTLHLAFERARADVIGDRVQDLVGATQRRISAQLEREQQRRQLLGERRDRERQRRELARERAQEGREREREHRSTLTVNALTLALAVTGLAGVASLAQTGYGLENDAPTTTVFIVLIVVLSALALVTVVRLYRASQNQRHSGDSSRLRRASPSRVSPLTDRDGIETVYREILQPSFPAAELVSVDSLVEGVTDGTTSILVLEREGHTQAVAIGDHDPQNRIVLLSYLAAAPGERGRGSGGQVLTAALEEWSTTWAPGIIIAEIEDPRAERAAGPSEHGDPWRRQRFYADHGAKALDLPYFQPALRPDLPRVSDMVLIAWPQDPLWFSPEGDRLLRTAGLEDFLADYTDDEALTGPDPDREGLLLAVRAEGGVILRPLASG